VDIGVVVGNPKPRSRTLQAATLLAQQLAGRNPVVVIDLADFGSDLLGWATDATRAAYDSLLDLDLTIFASPTYKASYTGLLKLFLDQIPTDGLLGTVAVPLMLGAGPHHALAPELLLKPVLVELGATCPTKGCYVLDSQFEDPAAYATWIERSRPVLDALTADGRRLRRATPET
jgi:FMN reductase